MKKPDYKRLWEDAQNGDIVARRKIFDHHERHNLPAPIFRSNRVQLPQFETGLTPEVQLRAKNISVDAEGIAFLVED